MKNRHINKVLILALFTTTSFVSSESAFAQLKAANNVTQVITAPNGVPVVNIANPNSAGLSNNLFTDYNVDSKGLVLNNQDTSQMQAASQLAGSVSANTNLKSEASVILNQVTSTNRSTLAGYTEVVGGTADVVVANPNGITCNGCGFINTAHTTLTTGVPLIANGGAGVLTGFNVNAGDILITGKGLDASRQDYIALFARSLAIQGQINAKYLDIIAGANTIDYTTKAATPQAGTGAAPTLAIDSSVLGGMYADRIRLIATEAGVGVRMLGDASAGAGDFTLTASGKVDLQNHISTQGNLQVTSTDNSGADSIKVTDVNLSSQGDTTLTAASGNIHLIGGLLYSQGNLTLQSATLTDEADANSLVINSQNFNNQRYAAGALNITQTGAATIDGTSFDAGGSLTGSAGSLALNNTLQGATLYGASLSYTTTNDMLLNKGALKTSGALSLTSTGGQISTTADAAQGIESTAGNVTITASNGFTNAGKVSADAGNLTTKVDGTLHNTGSLYAKTDALLEGYAGGATGTITNDGLIIGDNTLSTLVATLTNNGGSSNNGGMQGTKGGTISAATLTNSGTGEIVSSANASYSGTVDTSTLTNSGIIQSAKDLYLNVLNVLTNSNKILASHDLTISKLAAGGTTGWLQIDNNTTSGVLQAANTLTIQGFNGDHEANLHGNTGSILGNTLNLDLINLSNSNIIQGGTGASSINVQTATLTNGAAGDIKLGTTSAGSGTISAGTIADSGVIESKGALNLYAGAGGVQTAMTTGKIISDGNLTIRGLGVSSYLVYNNGIIQSTGGTLDIAGNGGGNAVDVESGNLDSAAVLEGNNVNWNVGTISFYGTGVKADNDLTITANTLGMTGSTSYVVANHNGTLTLANNLSDNAKIYGANAMTVTAPNITIVSGGALASSGTLTATANGGLIDNYATLFANTQLNVNSANFTNEAGGAVNGFGNASFTQSNTFTNYSNINVNGNLAISSLYFINEIVGGDTRSWDYLHTAACLSNSANCFVPSEASGITSANIDLSLLPDGAQDPRAGSQLHDHDNWSDIQVNNWVNVDLAGNPTGGHNPYGSSCSKSGAFCSTTDYYLATFNVKQYYTGYTPTSANRPNLQAGGTLTVNNFQTGQNLGGLMSGGTVNISSNRFGATFTNDDLSLRQQNWEVWWDEYQSCDALNRCGSWQYRSYDKWITGYATLSSVGAGIYASGQLNMSGFSLYNNGSSFAGVSSAGRGTPGSTGAPTTGTGGSTGSPSSPVNLSPLPVAPGFPPINPPPTCPNCIFISNPNPSFGPLFETNPQYQVGSSFLGPDYMVTTYGVDPDSVARQLGDANYDAYLIQQQVNNAGAAALLGTSDPGAAMQKLMDNGITTGKSLGLTIGVAPTASQIANLQNDMVWLVDTVVSGQHVLAPVVYLSEATKSQIASGAVVQASNVNMNLTSVTNTGGTIAGSNSLNMTTTGDITNTSGTITGGNVSLTSTGGNITNQTIADFANGVNGAKTATISSTGNLSLNAANNLTNTGAQLTAGGNASLNAGNDIDFNTIKNTQSTGSISSSSGAFSSSTTTTVTTTVTNVGSGLTVGGNLTSNSGGNTNLTNANINVTGNGSMTAGGNLNIMDAQNTSYTSTSTSGSGLGVGGGIYGEQTTTDTDTKGTSAGSTVHFGGNGSLTANSGAVTLQGSTVGAGGNMDINAQTVNVLAGQNTDEHTHTVTTTTYLSMGSNSASGNSGSNTDYTPTKQQQNMGQVPTNAAGANANASETANGSDLSLVDHKTTTTTENSTTAVGSNLSSGGNLTINSTGNTTLVGANVNAGGAANLNAGGDLNILAAQNTHTVTTTTEDTNVGFFTSSQNNANAGANAGYNSSSGGGSNTNDVGNVTGGGTSNTTGTASAGADASSDNKLDLVRVDQSSTTTADITHTGTTIHSGGNTTLGATNDINVQGSSVNAGGSLNVNAGNDLNVTAVTDSHTVTTSDSKTSAGLYADAGANANASASGIDGSKYGGVDTQANGSASANANAGIGLYGSNTTSGSTSGSTTAIVSSLTSGGDMTRTANGTITDQGTNINAGGNFTQTASSWNSEAAQNTTFSTTDSTTNTAKLGLYAGASASGSANYDQNVTTQTNNPQASVGVSASYDRNTSGSSSSTSNAVVSNIHSGGSFTSTTTGATTMEGTNVNAGGDLTLNASSLDYKAAQNTTSNSNSDGNINVGLKVGKGTSGYTADLSGGANELGTSSSSSTAVVGGLTSGGNLNVKTSGDQTYEGTNISAANNATVESTGGNVTFNAAQNTTSSSKNYEGFTGDISGNQKGGSLAFDGGTNSQSSSSSTAVTSTVSAGNGLTVKANNGLTMQGTNLTSGGDMTLGANTLNYEAAQNTSSSSHATQTLDVSASGSSSGGNKSGGGTGSYINTSTSDSSTTAVVGNINASSNLKVTTTGDQTYTGTNITAGKDATITSNSGAVNFNQAQNTSSSSSTQWGVSASASASSSQKGGDSKKGAIGGGYQTNSLDTTTGVAGNIKTGGGLTVTSDKDLTLQGTNINAGGDATLQSNNGSVNYQALTSTTTGSGWGVNAQLSGSSSSGGKGGDSSSKAGQVGGNYSSRHDVTETAGSITSGGNVTVKGKQDVTLVGTNVTSTGATSLTATNGNVNIEATKSTQDDQSYAAAIGVSKTSSGSGSTAKNNTGYKGGVDVNVNETSTETGATIKAGSLSITSGKDTNMTGTNVTTTGSGDTTINAGGNVNMAAAESTYGGVNLNVTMVQSNKIPGLSGGKILPPQNAGVSGGANYQGVSINSGGNLNVSSGGSTTMQSTQVTTGGAANIDAAGGLNQTSTTSGGIDVGYKLSLHPTGEASLDLPSTSDTKITAKGGTSTSNAVPLNPQQVNNISKGLTGAVASAPAELQTSLSNILNNASLSTADKFKQLANTIKNDPNLSQDDKTKMLNTLAQQQQSLSGQ